MGFWDSCMGEGLIGLMSLDCLNARRLGNLMSLESIQRRQRAWMMPRWQNNFSDFHSLFLRPFRRLTGYGNYRPTIGNLVRAMPDVV